MSSCFRCPIALLPKAQSLAGLHLLVVEDETDNRDLLVFVLENEAAQVTAVASAEEALVALGELRPDVMVCDIGLPDKDGCALLQEWREREIDLGLFPIPAIAATGYADEQQKQMILDSGFQCCIVKPYDTAELLQALVNLVASTDPALKKCNQS